MSNYIGVVIEESLKDTTVLKLMTIKSTEKESVTTDHQTPWINQWTKHTVSISADQASDLAKKIAHSFDSKHNWYADYKNKTGTSLSSQTTYSKLIDRRELLFINPQ